MRNFFIAAHFTRGNIVIVEFSQWRDRKTARGSFFCIFFSVKNEIFHFPPLLSSSAFIHFLPHETQIQHKTTSTAHWQSKKLKSLFLFTTSRVGKTVLDRHTHIHTYSLASYFALKIYKFHCSWNVAVSLSLSLSFSIQQRRSDG